MDAEILLAALKKYHPFDEAEKASVEAFIFFIEKFGNDIWTRNNLTGHLCASAWVVNKEKSKILMAYHNTYKSYAWLGGHADGEKDLSAVAEKEAKEETGISKVTLLNKGRMLDVDTHECMAHVKRGRPVAAHLHFNVTYLFEADEKDVVQAKEDENADVRWIKIEDVLDSVTEEHMKPVYERLIKKMEQIADK